MSWLWSGWKKVRVSHPGLPRIRQMKKRKEKKRPINSSGNKHAFEVGKTTTRFDPSRKWLKSRSPRLMNVNSFSMLRLLSRKAFEIWTLIWSLFRNQQAISIPSIYCIFILFLWDCTFFFLSHLDLYSCCVMLKWVGCNPPMIVPPCTTKFC